ncbi:hypothetical protein [Nostoc sp.]|uniref:hypothetical protein n=1 Tax=Nostoc sp. TaxID=1180 RepID=UPI002FF676E9
MLRVGNLVINLGAIAYVNLEAKQSYVTDRESTVGVRVYFLASDDQTNLDNLFFKGEDVEYLRKYFTSIARSSPDRCICPADFASLCGGVE